MIVALTSETLSIGELFAMADTVLSPRIASVEGVGQVFVGGGAQPAVRVQVEPAALMARGLGLDDVRRAIAGSSVLRPTGSVTASGRRLDVLPELAALRRRRVPPRHRDDERRRDRAALRRRTRRGRRQ